MGFLIYRASAGSGKTFTLVKEYVKLLLQDPDRFKHILAITFTNKAAGEMKDRILHALLQLAEGSHTVLADQIKRELPEITGIQKQSRRILSLLLHHYSDFSITTIDSFMFRLIRAFSLELGLPLNFQVELNNEKIGRYVEGHLMSQVGNDPYTTRVILQYVKQRIAAEKSWNITGELRKFVKDIIQESNDQWIREAGAWDGDRFLAFVSEMDGIKRNFTERMTELGKQGMDRIETAGLSVEDFPYKMSGAAGYLSRLADKRPGRIRELSLPERFKNGVWVAKNMSVEIRNRIEVLLETGLGETVDKIMHLYSSDYPRALSASVILEQGYLMALHHQIKDLVNQYKLASSIVPITEFGTMINEIVRESPVPFVYAILGERYHHYLMDEFQDTSELQWENLFPLIENALSYDHLNMAVGDAKQSIYRWRGSDAEILEREIEKKFDPSQIKNKDLVSNFRSLENIVMFNNRLFKSVTEFFGDVPCVGEGIYRSADQEAVLGSGGHVTLTFATVDSAEGVREQSLENLVNRIGGALQRGFDYRDMAILVRTGMEGAAAADCLIRNGIPVISPDSLKLSHSSVVRFMLSIMAFLVNRSDKVALCQMLYFISMHLNGISLSYSDIERYFMSGDMSVLPDNVARLMGGRDFYIRLPLYELVEEVVRLFGMPMSVTHHCAGYLQDFMDVVHTYHSEQGGDISSFLDWWEILEEDLSTGMPEKRDAISVLTFHKAKGLEFPVVFVHNADWKHVKDGEKMWLRTVEPMSENPLARLPLLVRRSRILEETLFHNDLAEENNKNLLDNLNLLYVVFTRAQEELHIFSGIKNRNSGFLKNAAETFMDQDKTLPNRFGYGRAGHKVTETDKAGESSVVLGDMVSNGWYPRISIKRKYPELLRIHRDRVEEKIQWGSLLHDILAQIHYKGEEDDVLDRFIEDGFLAREKCPVVKEMITGIYNHPQAAEWFDPEAVIFTERSLVHRGEILRPDRVIIREEKVVVAEFKSGERDQRNRDQVQLYREALMAMGYPDVKSYLFYLSDSYLEQV